MKGIARIPAPTGIFTQDLIDPSCFCGFVLTIYEFERLLKGSFFFAAVLWMWIHVSATTQFPARMGSWMQEPSMEATNKNVLQILGESVCLSFGLIRFAECWMACCFPLLRYSGPCSGNAYSFAQMSTTAKARWSKNCQVRT